MTETQYFLEMTLANGTVLTLVTKAPISTGLLDQLREEVGDISSARVEELQEYWARKTVQTNV